jgi:Tfp pilus assembly protein PilF
MNKTFRGLSKVGRLGLCFSTMLGFAGGGNAAEEAMTVEKFELMIVETSLGGNEMAAGEYAAAVEKITTSLSMDSKYAKSTNLCVAYTAQGDFASAQPHCQTALRLSRSSDLGSIVMTRVYVARKNRQAMSLNNLGVWHALQGNTDEAQGYFQSASNKSSEVSATTNRNIDVLELRMGSATVAAS